MIIANGYIRVKTLTGGGLDANGFPVPASESLSGYVECQYRASSLNLAALSDAGEPIVSQSYTILIESGRSPFTAETIVLYDAQMAVVGEFEVRRIQELQRLGQVRLYV